MAYRSVDRTAALSVVHWAQWVNLSVVLKAACWVVQKADQTGPKWAVPTVALSEIQRVRPSVARLANQMVSQTAAQMASQSAVQKAGKTDQTMVVLLVAQTVDQKVVR